MASQLLGGGSWVDVLPYGRVPDGYRQLSHFFAHGWLDREALQGTPDALLKFLVGLKVCALCTHLAEPVSATKHQEAVHAALWCGVVDTPVCQYGFPDEQVPACLLGRI